MNTRIKKAYAKSDLTHATCDEITSSYTKHMLVSANLVLLAATTRPRYHVHHRMYWPSGVVWNRQYWVQKETGIYPTRICQMHMHMSHATSHGQHRSRYHQRHITHNIGTYDTSHDHDICRVLHVMFIPINIPPYLGERL